ncbi:MAG: hypothetical protein GX193_04535 [Clostridiales bacterium]|nr:hypothetical protein [Clostridiales bacterium]
MLNLAVKVYHLLKSEKGETKFDSALQIVISFVIGAIILSALAGVFDTTIGVWLEKTAKNWFNSAGATLPPIPTSG